MIEVFDIFWVGFWIVKVEVQEGVVNDCCDLKLYVRFVVCWNGVLGCLGFGCFGKYGGIGVYVVWLECFFGEIVL